MGARRGGVHVVIWEWLGHFTGAVNPLNLFLIALMESIFFPIPPDTVLLPLVLLQPGGGVSFAGLATLGSVVGAGIGYFLGRWGGRPLVERIASRDKIDRVGELFNKYEFWAIGIAGFTPIPFKVFTLSAGAFRVRFRPFIFAAILSRGARFLMEAVLVMLYGRQIIGFIRSDFNILTVAVVVAVGVLWLGIKAWRGYRVR